MLELVVRNSILRLYSVLNHNLHINLWLQREKYILTPIELVFYIHRNIFWFFCILLGFLTACNTKHRPPTIHLCYTPNHGINEILVDIQKYVPFDLDAENSAFSRNGMWWWWHNTFLNPSHKTSTIFWT